MSSDHTSTSDDQTEQRIDDKPDVMDDADDMSDSDDVHETEVAYERAPPDFESDISLDDATVPDDPVVVTVDGKGEASAYLVTQEEINEFAKQADANDAEAFAEEAIVELLNRKYVSPSFDLTVEQYRNGRAGYYEKFFNAIVPDLGNQ